MSKQSLFVLVLWYLCVFDIGLLHTGGATVYAIEGDGAAAEDIKDSALFGAVLPNAQLTLGWGF